jgi:hypothetical protein
MALAQCGQPKAIDRPICSGTPSRSRRPTPLMGCAASSDRAERRGRAHGHKEASTSGLLLLGPADQEPLAAWRRRGWKVAPEPKEHDEAAPEPAMPGSPSFRYYCQKAAAVDALVAEADAADGEGSVRITGKLPPRPLLITTCLLQQGRFETSSSSHPDSCWN